MMKLKIKTEEDRINEDSLWLGRNMPSLQKDFRFARWRYENIGSCRRVWNFS